MKNYDFMKLLLLSGCILFCTYVSAQTKISKEVNKVSGADSFYFHYNILDSISKKKGGYDKSVACIPAVTYLEKITRIKAHPTGDYFGWKSFSSSDLVKWDKWYRRKYPRIRYEPKILKD